ncbi:hypothetical protein ABIE26_002990 [Pedobacter africanus]|uniref:hypothetical protein n=1 Tax=Pedobacter africanus TaxID=151894 RepID=UPI003399C76F
MPIKRRNITQAIRKQGDPKKWVYRVVRRGKHLLVTVRITCRFMIHPKPIAPPKLITELKPDEILVLSPGEWSEIWFQGEWCHMADADCRNW